ISTTRGVNSTFLCSKDSGLPDFVMEFELQRGLVGFTGANANYLFHCRDENLAITNFAGMRGLDNGFNCASSRLDGITTSILILGKKSTTYSAPRYNSVCPFCRPKPFTSVTVNPLTPNSESASRTSSNLNGLITASIFFMVVSLMH